ncbi:MAG: hypothetical protein E6R14_10100 [Thermomicrobiales bacterium]|nr:MAG: hypothetical protein E6R14_10100 [Thermomicrobiales bacterium]
MLASKATSFSLAEETASRHLLTPMRRHAWIVDTCIEHDHQRFGGFLKISVEELLIALRDDRHLLNDPEGLLAGRCPVLSALETDRIPRRWSLYPEGFSAERLVQVIETEAVWDVLEQTVEPSS